MERRAPRPPHALGCGDSGEGQQGGARKGLHEGARRAHHRQAARCQYTTVQHRRVKCHAVLYSTVWYCTV